MNDDIIREKFYRKYASLTKIFLDEDLSKLGDAFVNFIFSLALSLKKASPTNSRVSGTILSEALKRAGCRRLLPRRTDRHKQSDAVEALMIYAWLENILTLEEFVTILQQKADKPIEAFAFLITTVINKLELPDNVKEQL